MPGIRHADNRLTEAALSRLKHELKQQGTPVGQISLISDIEVCIDGTVIQWPPDTNPSRVIEDYKRMLTKGAPEPERIREGN